MPKYTSDSRLFHDTIEEKRRYKLYKKGKLWVTAGMSLAFAGMILTNQVTVNADVQDVQDQTVTTKAQPADHKVVLPATKSAKTAAPATKAADATVASQQTTPTTQTVAAAPVAATATRKPFGGIAATIQDQTKAQDNNAATDPAVYAVTLAAGLKQPAWTGDDFDTTGITSQSAGQYAVTLTSAGLAKLRAANPTYTFSAANVQAGHLTINAAAETKADTTSTAKAAVASSAAKTEAPAETAATKTTEAPAETAPAAKPATPAKTDATTATTTITATPTDEASAATVANIAQGATKTAAQLDQYVQQDNDLAAASATDNVVNNSAMKALQDHQASEKQQVLDLTSAAKAASQTDAAAALTKLSQAAQILNTMNDELTQATTMLREDRQGAATNAEAIAQAALDQATLPAGSSGKVDTYGDLILNAPNQAAYQAALQAIKDQGLFGRFRQVVDPQSAATLTLVDEALATITVANGTSNPVRVLKLNLTMNKGDVITVTVPSAFTVTSDDVLNVQSATDADGNTVLTYTADNAGAQGINLALNLKSAVTQLKNKATLPVLVKVNGAVQAEQDFVVDNDLDVALTQFLLDNNQGTNTLMTDQDYGYAVTGTASIDTYEHTISVNGKIKVPAGFVLDAGATDFQDEIARSNEIGSIQSASDGNTYLNEDSSLLMDGKTDSVTQPDGPGGDLIVQSGTLAGVLFRGHYTTPMPASDNVFQADLTYTTAAGDAYAATYTAKLNNAVSDQNSDIRSSNNSLFQTTSTDLVWDEMPKDTTAGGMSAAQEANYLNANGIRGFAVINDGNTAEHDVHMSVDLEPGTETNYFDVPSSADEPLKSLVVTYSDGHTETPDITAPQSDSVTVTPESMPNVTKIDAVWDKVDPGYAAFVELVGSNALLTTKKVGDTANYHVTVSSAENPETSQDFSRKITGLQARPYQVRVIVSTINLGQLDNGALRPGETQKVDVGLYPDMTGKPLGIYYVSAPRQMKLTGVTLDSTPVSLIDTGSLNSNGQPIYEIDLSKVMGSFSDILHLNYQLTPNPVPMILSGNSFCDLVFQQASADYQNDDGSPMAATDLKFGSMTVATTGGDQVNGNQYAPYHVQILVPSYFNGQDGIDDPFTTGVDYLKYDQSNPQDHDCRVFARGNDGSD